MKLSDHFNMREFTRSDTAERLGIDNTPDSAARLQLAYLCQSILEPIRRRYGMPIHVTSGFRCAELNKAVGGVSNSQHLTGDAADIRASATSNNYLFKIIEQMVREGEITVGQLIWEGGNEHSPAWIHISNPRKDKTNNDIMYFF